MNKTREQWADIDQQADPAETTDTYTAVEMATAAAQGFRDGQAAVEPAPAQDEREAFEARMVLEAGPGAADLWIKGNPGAGYSNERVNDHRFGWVACLEWMATRPAQTEQQPVTVPEGWKMVPIKPTKEMLAVCKVAGKTKVWDDMLAAAPIAQTAPQGKFRMGDLVKKSTGSEWEGRVVGWYSTEQTPEGYAVESSAHRNSVQIYPAKALELVPMAAKEA